MSIKSLEKGLILLAALILVGCGSGGSGSEIPPATLTSFELLDPTPGIGDEFGQWVIILPNGNIVVSDPNDSTNAPGNGAVHLYSSSSRSLIASSYGDGADDRLGFINNLASGVIGLPNGNYVIASSRDTVGGIHEAGSVRLMNGTTGVQIGATIAGDEAFDWLGLDGLTALANSNFVIASSSDDDRVNSILNAGSVRLVNGSTGEQIDDSIVGDTPGDQLGFDGTTALTNNNYVIASSQDDVGGKINVGSVRLVSGVDGLEIDLLAGDLTGDQLGSDGTTALTNGNYVIASSFDTENGISNAGSVRLADGDDGTQIYPAIVGDNVNDRIGSGGTTALTNGNYVIASPLDDVLVSNAGSVILVDTDGKPKGTAITGDKADDELGSDGVTALPHHYYVIASSIDDEGGILNAGSVRLVNGVTGIQSSTPIVGDIENDRLGSRGTTALPNGNFAIGSPDDTEAGIVAAGSVRLADGLTGVEIGNAIVGATAADSMGFDGTTALANSNYVTVTRFEDVDGVVNSGSIRLVNGATGSQIGNTIAGNTADDMNGAIVVGSSSGDYFVIGLGLADNSGLIDSGFVYLIAE